MSIILESMQVYGGSRYLNPKDHPAEQEEDEDENEHEEVRK
jgi:hypothetical protein